MTTRTAVVAIVAAVIAAPALAQDAIQWTEAKGGNGHWYHVDPTTQLDWDMAEEAARASGGELICLETRSEQAWIEVNITGVDFWLGLFQPEGTGEPGDGWEWVSGQSYVYDNWDVGQPNDGNGSNDVGKYRHNSQAWDDTAGSSGEVDAFVIEYSADCNGDGIVDYGQLLDGTGIDMDGNGVLDVCEYEEDFPNHVLELNDWPSTAIIPHHPSLNPGDELTIEFWTKIESGGRMVTKRPGDSGSYTIWADTSEGDCAAWSGFFNCAWGGDPWEGFGCDWAHLAVVIDAPNDSRKHYVNGQLTSETLLVDCSIPQGTWDLRLGNTWEYPTTQFRGRLDNVRIWNEALDEEQIRFWMHNTITPERARSLPTLGGSWGFENGVDDATGVNNGYLEGNANIVIDNGRLQDCNLDGINDYGQILNGSLEDCNGNLVPDECELSEIFEASEDRTPESVVDFIEFDVSSMADTDDPVTLVVRANGDLATIGEFLFVYLDNALIDLAFVDDGAACQDVSATFSIPAADWNAAGSDPTRLIRISGNAIDPDACASPMVGVRVIVPIDFVDCNENGIWDACDIHSGEAIDLDGNGIPDSCDPDCDGDGEPDGYEISSGQDADCNGNLVPDSCDISEGTSNDVDSDGVPDECQPDCDGDGDPDSWELSEGYAMDCNRNGYPDNCDILEGTSNDVDDNGVPDECKDDCNGNGVPDYWEILDPNDEYDVEDCDGNGIPDECDIAAGNLEDCDLDGRWDQCAIDDGSVSDCNENGIPDSCDIGGGKKEDENGNGVPDSCDLARGDLNLDGCIDGGDLGVLIALWGEERPPVGDLDGDGVIGGGDLGQLLGNWMPCP